MIPNRLGLLGFQKTNDVSQEVNVAAHPRVQVVAGFIKVAGMRPEDDVTGVVTGEVGGSGRVFHLASVIQSVDPPVLLQPLLKRHLAVL